MIKILIFVTCGFLILGCKEKIHSQDVSMAGDAFSVDTQDNCNYIEAYYPFIYLAEIEYYSGNHQEAFDLYSKAFESCPPKNSVYHYEINKFAELATVLGKQDLALDYIEKGLREGDLLQFYTKDTIYVEILESERGKKLVQHYDKFRQEYLAGLNLELREEIQRMMAADQRYRRGRNDPLNNRERADSIDEIHEKRIVQIFGEIGYPNSDMIGGYLIDQQPADISILLLHTDDSIRMNCIVPKLRDFVRAGVCPPDVLGAVIDQFHLYNGDLQIYGTYGNREKNMIPDLEQVDKNRISIGLPPLALQEKLEVLKGI